ncbi:hypothetical protein ONS95_001984 [Cadophora gregata]|uniref:uncharacterized protein n=1 Tax=Cadophora gregata TaxID=51156 RepID=UPI0026DCFE36|nr:uncharacterized protein ONS95_001984 [Cadophora gregata]KAK0111640.1 hypothetical protein ONS95_001984 [Cadophora gregata]
MFAVTAYEAWRVIACLFSSLKERWATGQQHAILIQHLFPHLHQRPTQHVNAEYSTTSSSGSLLPSSHEYLTCFFFISSFCSVSVLPGKRGGLDMASGRFPNFRISVLSDFWFSFPYPN